MPSNRPLETSIEGLRLAETIIQPDESPETEWAVDDTRTWCGQIILVREGCFKVTRHHLDKRRDYEAETVAPGEHTAVYRIAESTGRWVIRMQVLQGPVTTWCLIYPTKRLWPQMEEGRSFGPYDRDQIFFLWEGSARVGDADLAAPAFITLAPGRVLTTEQDAKFVRFEEDEARWQRILAVNPPR